MRPLIGIVTTDRPQVLEACLRHLLAYDRHRLRDRAHIRIADNSVQDTTLPVIRMLQLEGFDISYSRLDGGHDGSAESAESELGRSRRWLADWFALHREFDHLVLLDDDMLVTADTIVDAVTDLTILRDMGVGCMSLHPFKKRFQPVTYNIGRRTFITFDYTGDSSWIIPRDVFEQTGNLFRASRAGFANNMFAAIRDLGLTSVTALSPCYEIQHVGVEDLMGTRIHKKAERKPGWTKVLFSDYLTGRVLYSDIVMTWKLGSVQHIIAALRKEMAGMQKSKKGETARDQFPRAQGKVDILVQDAKTGKTVQELHIQNLVVDNAKTIMAHLLGGSASADYALDKMTFGTGSTSPTENDTGIEIPLSPTKGVTVDYPDADSVRFTGVLESDEANGFPIHEAGLFSGSQGMAARVVFGPLTKSEDFRFVFRWTIYW